PQREFDAEYFLERDGLDVFVPYRVEFRRPNRYVKAKREVRYPLMRGYIFVGFDGPAPWWTLFNRHRGLLLSVVGLNGRPYRIPDSGMDHMRSISARRAPMPWRHMKTHAEFNVGDNVRIIGGPF